MGVSKVSDLRQASFVSIVGTCTRGALHVGSSLVFIKKKKEGDRGVGGKVSVAVCYMELHVTLL